MANRNDSDARQHETLPGPGPGSSAPVGGGGRPVEQMVDAAIERIAVEREAREQRSREKNGSVDLVRRSTTEASLARRDAAQALKVPTRLRWKGLEVSDEFRQYAERIARGEELPPFEGRVLAEPNPAFPWDAAGGEAEPAAKQRGAHPAVWGAAIVVLGLLGWSVALKLEGAEPGTPVETTVAPLTAPAPTAELEAKPNATPPDVVETPAIDVLAPTTEPAVAQPELSPAFEPPAVVSSSAAPAPVLATPAVGLVANEAPASPPPASAGASVSVDLSRPGALQQAVGAALASSNASVSPAPVAASPSIRDDEFGIMASVSPTPAATPPAAGAVAPAPAGAKSSGSVGDLARAGQPAGSGVRKEPGSESSAKGSLLVETPSF